MTVGENDYIIGLYDGEPLYRRRGWGAAYSNAATSSSVTINRVGEVNYYDYRNCAWGPFATANSITEEPATEVYYGVDWTNWDRASVVPKAKKARKQEEDGEFAISKEMEEFLDSL